MFKKIFSVFHTKPDKDLDKIFGSITSINKDNNKEEKIKILDNFIKEIKFFIDRMYKYQSKKYTINEDRLIDLNNETLRIKLNDEYSDTIIKLTSLNNYFLELDYTDIRYIPVISLQNGIINYRSFLEYKNTEKLIDDVIVYLETVIDLINMLKEEREFNVLLYRFHPILIVSILIIDYINQELIEYDC